MKFKPEEFEVILGDTVECTVTGLKGIATARCLYLHGCDHIGIQPPADNKIGKVPALVWIDSPQVKIINAVNKKTEEKTELFIHRRRGGPAEHPRERNHPNYNEGTVLGEYD